MLEFSPLQQDIIRYIRREKYAMREDIIRDVANGGEWTRKDVQEQLAYLRRYGYVYRVPDGWYQTDVEID